MIYRSDIQNNSYSDRQYVCDRSSIETLSSANAAGRIQREHVREELSPQEAVDNTTALQSGQRKNTAFSLCDKSLN